MKLEILLLVEGVRSSALETEWQQQCKLPNTLLSAKAMLNIAAMESSEENMSSGMISNLFFGNKSTCIANRAPELPPLDSTAESERADGQPSKQHCIIMMKTGRQEKEKQMRGDTIPDQSV
ncbi:unnamed protein product [Natator depressus]